MTVVANENNELIPTRLVTGWRVCIDYKKLNDATRKDHFPLPFMDQMLEGLAGNEFYCFLDGFSGYFQIPIDPQDQEKTTFTCPYGTFAYRHMPFGLCNAPGTFQRCTMSIFHDMIEKMMEVFMDDFSVFEDSYSSCLTNLDKMLERCEETNLVLNREKCHFMCREGIVLGVRSFLGHAGFYRHFIQDFSKIARPVTHILEKETPFVFFKECIDAFNTLKKKLTEASILVVPNWNLPFELMCDSSDYAIGAVLGQRKTKHFQPIHYASKTITEAQKHYTTTKKEMLAVVYAFEKFRPYLILSKSIDYTDHSALKYLLNKQDAKPRQEAFKILKAYREGPIGAIMVPISQRRRDKEKSLKKMRCLKTLSKFVRYLMYERTVGENGASWSNKLDDALWAFRTAYKTPIGCTPYKLVYGKSCHLPIELEHRAYWALKHVNFDLKTAGDHRKLQLNELSLALQLSSQYFLWDLKTRWSGPFTITQVFPYGTIELSQPNGPNFKVNGHRVKHYFGGDIPSNVAPDLHTFPTDN
nr:reverse transcriptase domain-containing protein [Tanacetum cinerariifolium]